MRKGYKMEQSDLEKILDAINGARSTPLIMLQCGMPQSPQEAANEAWKALADKMNFIWDTVRPTGESDLHFTAEEKQ